MIYFYNQVIYANSIVTSVQHYIGSTNSTAPLMTNPIQALLVKGATDNITVTLQAAVVPTPVDQSVQPVNSDFINVTNGTYNSDTTAAFPSLNGMWVRFQVNNTTGVPANVTCLLE